MGTLIFIHLLPKPFNLLLDYQDFKYYTYYKRKLIYENVTFIFITHLLQVVFMV